jgi:hypothetical protein
MAPFGAARGAGQPQDDSVWHRAIGAGQCIFMQEGAGVGEGRGGATTGGEGAATARGIRGGTGECRRDPAVGGGRGEGGDEHKIRRAGRGSAGDISC